MADIKVKQYIEVYDDTQVRRYGSETAYETVALDGGGKVHYNRFDAIDTSSTPQLLYDSSSSPIPNGAKLYFIRANTTGYVGIDSGGGEAYTSAIPIYANVWICLGGPSMKQDGATSSGSTRLSGYDVTQIDRIYYQAGSGTDANVEILGVS